MRQQNKSSWGYCLDLDGEFLDKGRLSPLVPEESYDECMEYRLSYDKTPTLCLHVTIEPLILSNCIENRDGSYYSFGPYPKKFGVENCATHHRCSKKFLFVGKIHKILSIGLRDVALSAIAEGIDTVAFKIANYDGTIHNITIDNLIYLPSAVNNLISIS